MNNAENIRKKLLVLNMDIGEAEKKLQDLKDEFWELYKKVNDKSEGE